MLERVADKTLIFDEAHLLFSFPKLCEALFKLPDASKAPRMLLFSAASQGEKDGVATLTPGEIRKKVMWHPPMPDAKEAAELAVSLKEADVSLSADSVLFFFKLCGGHRGIFMSAMEWVRQEQQPKADKEKEEVKLWDIGTSVAEVRASLANSATKEAGGWDEGFRAAVAQSRAVKVNSKFSDLDNIPIAFARVLAGGPTKRSGLDGLERLLTVAGFLVPERPEVNEEFDLYDWTGALVRYTVSNPFMAAYYRVVLTSERHLKIRLGEDMKNPRSRAHCLSCPLLLSSILRLVKTAPTRCHCPPR